MILAPITSIFCDIDDLYKQYLTHAKTLPKKKGSRERKTQMSISEMMTIVVLFHLSHYRTFKAFYLECVLEDLSSYFPYAVSYPRFIALMPRVLAPLTAYILSKRGKATNLYYIDSTPVAVCHNRRITNHKVFKYIATRGHSSVGYFFGFKLHLLINHQGELVNFCITKGNVDDRKTVPQLMRGLTGLAAGDKGYLDKKLEDTLSQQGLQFITKVRKNMKHRIRTAFERYFLAQRSIIETVIGQLKNICQIEHTRHRSPTNFLVNLISGLAGYCLKPRKPALHIHSLTEHRLALIHN